MALTLDTLILLCATGLVAGFVDSIAGGGGLLTVPALLAAGLPPQLALGTNKLAATFGSFTASLTFYRKKLFNPILWRHALLATAIGALLGVMVVDRIPAGVLEKVLPLAIALTAIYTLVLRRKTLTSESLPPPSPQLTRRQWAQGLGLGFYDGAFGPGTGAFWTVSNVALHKLSLLNATGMTKAMNFVSNICALTAFALLGHVDLWIGVVMGLAIMVGAFVGAHTAIRFGARFIRPFFILAVLSMSLYLGWRAW